MSTKAAEELGRRAGAIAFETAATYVEALRAQSLVEPQAFADTLARHVDGEFEAALTDAEKAWFEGYDEVAEVTFVASMQLAGVRAAKEYLGID